MQTFTKTLRSIGLFIFLLLMGYNSKALTFIAVASGNFNSSSTWGGIAPGSLLSSDIVIIPSGITVALTNNQTISGSSTLTVNGVLNSASSNGNALILTGGSLSGNGSIVMDSMLLALNNGFSYTGTIVTNKLVSMGATISSAANITVNNTLGLSSGTMNMAAGTLSLASGATIALSGGMMNASNPNNLNLTNSYNVIYSNNATISGSELTGSGLNNVTINNTTGNLSLSGNMALNGVLTLTAGNLILNNNDLVFGTASDFSAMGTGTISSTQNSNIIIQSANGLSGALRFTSGANSVNNFVINTGSGSSSVNLASDMVINGQLALTSGLVFLNNSTVTLTQNAMVTGGNASSFIVTNGTGALNAAVNAGSSVVFNVGTASSGFAPITVTASSTSTSGNVNVRIIDTVYAQGTTGSNLAVSEPLVNATWMVSSNMTTGFNYTLTASWNTNMEVNGFNRNQAYISHYTSDNWDFNAASSATASGNMYTMTRTGITSLSPFTVADKDARLAGISKVTAKNAAISIYPNPATDQLSFGTKGTIETARIYNMSGQIVKEVMMDNNQLNISTLNPGLYTVELKMNDQIVSGNFVKQ